MTDSLFDADWLAQLASYHTLLVGFSGGLDSTVLLHRLASEPALANKLSVVHIHHGLSPNADAWLQHCQTICASLSLPLTTRHIEFEQHANIEENARQARYEVFASLLSNNSGLLLAHHADDQAETVLLQLLRGTGVDGLAAMPAVKPLGCGDLLRPFLQHSRASLEAYACLHQLSWIDDESNQDSISFSRNYLRHQVMPLLRARWPGAVKNLARTATHCQQAKNNLHALADLDCAELAGNTLSLSALAPILSSPRRRGSIPDAVSEPQSGWIPALAGTTAKSSDETMIQTSTLNTCDSPRIANVLRVWLGNNQIKLPSTHTFNRIITEVILACEDAVPCVEWDGICVRRYQDTLYLLTTEVVSHPISMEWLQFPDPLQWGEAFLCATSVKKGLHVPAGSRVSVRVRQGGELFYWRGQTKALKKLLQEWHIPPWNRDRVPLIYVDDELAAVVGFAVSDRFYRTNVAYTYQIELNQELPCLNH